MPVDSMGLAHAVPPEPWRSFLHDFDAQLKGAVALRCLGGFVVTQQYGIGRGTSDIDFLFVTAVSAEDNVEVLGGLGSDLYKKYRVYLQYVGIATPPCDYADRLQRMFPRARWAKLQLFALDPIDLALSKLERNWAPDAVKDLSIRTHRRRCHILSLKTGFAVGEIFVEDFTAQSSFRISTQAVQQPVVRKFFFERKCPQADLVFDYFEALSSSAQAGF
jgi:hypothetical protein